MVRATVRQALIVGVKFEMDFDEFLFKSTKDEKVLSSISELSCFDGHTNKLFLSGDDDADLSKRRGISIYKKLSFSV